MHKFTNYYIVNQRCFINTHPDFQKIKLMISFNNGCLHLSPMFANTILTQYELLIS